MALMEILNWRCFIDREGWLWASHGEDPSSLDQCNERCCCTSCSPSKCASPSRAGAELDLTHLDSYSFNTRLSHVKCALAPVRWYPLWFLAEASHIGRRSGIQVHTRGSIAALGPAFFLRIWNGLSDGVTTWWSPGHLTGWSPKNHYDLVITMLV